MSQSKMIFSVCACVALAATLVASQANNTPIGCVGAFQDAANNYRKTLHSMTIEYVQQAQSTGSKATNFQSILEQANKMAELIGSLADTNQGYTLERITGVYQQSLKLNVDILQNLLDRQNFLSQSIFGTTASFSYRLMSANNELILTLANRCTINAGGRHL